MMTRQPTKIALGGFGNVGRQLARAILADPDGGIEIAAISARDLAAAAERAAALGIDAPVVPAIEAPHYAQIVVECATYDGFRGIVEPALTAAAHVVAVSVGALAVNLDLIDLAAAHKTTLQIASGALPGLDMVRAAREGKIRSVTLESRILPTSFAGEPYISDHGIDLQAAERGPVRIFRGSARSAAGYFPRHFNVAVALSLAGIGLDRTKVEIFADGTVAGTCHTVRLSSDLVDLEMTSRNFPSPDNRRTSRLVAPSILAAVRELHAPLRIGS